ncbi:MAG: hypothetical protein ACO35C_01030 [Pontimonas sp.]
MQLGSRFSVGQAPTSLPGSLIAEMETIEATLNDEERVTLRWTLTWLENRPVVTLDNGVTLRG